jgi:glycosyltransferase involved in cell wall biosynthesis
MRVAVNLLWCVAGQVGGSEQYLVRQMVARHEHGSPELDIVAFAPRGLAVAQPGLTRAATVVETASDSTSRPARVARESWWLGPRTRSFDVVQHGGGTLPLIVTGGATVLTIHDLQYLTYPGTFSPMKLAWLRRSVPRAARRADVITTPSQWVADTVRDLTGRPADEVICVPHPIPPSETVEPTGAQDLRTRFHLPGPYVVFPAITYRHKNHAVLVRAAAALAARQPELRWVFIGGPGPAEAEVGRLAAELGVQNRIVRPGRVSDGDRNGLIAGAAALVFPSRYEGFGAPVIEAMHLATPVLAARATALVEVVGPAGVLLDPDDPEAWAEAVEVLVTDQPAAERLRRAGTIRAADFDGRSTAVALELAYRRAAS